ncbi:hypothetical protein J6590_051972 [Homalodisca vitripennis]|nr:hypothetical protein J6590_051972 [Homalodisca vitripennis]
MVNLQSESVSPSAFVAAEREGGLSAPEQNQVCQVIKIGCETVDELPADQHTGPDIALPVRQDHLSVLETETSLPPSLARTPVKDTERPHSYSHALQSRTRKGYCGITLDSDHITPISKHYQEALKASLLLARTPVKDTESGLGERLPVSPVGVVYVTHGQWNMKDSKLTGSRLLKRRVAGTGATSVPTQFKSRRLALQLTVTVDKLDEWPGQGRLQYRHGSSLLG